ncbi:hypothetical protein LIER_28298 [Lithospermum erythrorhizon]|uniref:Uncharacterized protein n=1 Tax=Lithospermum erythrorhizon TaxID=34254 RepID=A0AAV3RIW2_LITER
MASALSNLLRYKSQLPPLTSFIRRETVKYYCSSTVNSVNNEEDVVIIGAGVAGLATAVALKSCDRGNGQEKARKN